MIVFFVYNILIFNYKDTKNYRDYQLFKRISYPELRLLLLIIAVMRVMKSQSIHESRNHFIEFIIATTPPALFMPPTMLQLIDH